MKKSKYQLYSFLPLYFCFLLFVVSCAFSSKTPTSINTLKNDTVFIVKEKIVYQNDSLLLLKHKNRLLQDSLKKYIHLYDSCSNTINYADWDAKFKCAKVKRYIAICKSRPKNKKYFYGWILRTFNQ